MDAGCEFSEKRDIVRARGGGARNFMGEQI
jgi:hypothetical protein